MRGNITRRGKSSWRIKIELEPNPDGSRRIHYETVKGKKQDADTRLTELLGSLDKNTFVEASKVTVAEYVRAWLKVADLSPKTLERYQQLADQQIIPHLGATALQKLKPVQIQDWLATLLKSGGENAAPLAARTVGHARRVLHTAIARAVLGEVVARNVVSGIKAPKVEEREIEILDAPQIAEVLAKLEGHTLLPVVTLALATGMRRGELVGLQWGDIDLEGASLQVERNVVEVANKLIVKAPKSKRSRRALSLPHSAVAALRAYRKTQLENRLALGLGRPEGDAIVFCDAEGGLLSPDDDLTSAWIRAVASRKLPKVTFHALRHTHASALIDSGLDVVKISRRLGHSSPVVTLRVYAHLFDRKKGDTQAADAIEKALRG